MNTLLSQILENKNLALKTIGANPQLVQPLGSYIVVKLIKADEYTLGGIALTAQSIEKNQPQLAEVISVGPGQRGMTDGVAIPVCTKPGDLVLVVKHTPYEIKLNGEVFWVAFEGDLLGVINQEELAVTLAVEQARLEAERLDREAKLAAEEATKGKLVEKLDDGELRESKGGILIATAGA
jgi:co-chaperonin GroES (HSP10)